MVAPLEWIDSQALNMLPLPMENIILSALPSSWMKLEFQGCCCTPLYKSGTLEYNSFVRTWICFSALTL